MVKRLQLENATGRNCTVNIPFLIPYFHEKHISPTGKQKKSKKKKIFSIEKYKEKDSTV